MHILVIIPTYNEKSNIELIIKSVLKLDERLSILVVDDNSPDETYKIVEELQKDSLRVFLLKREGKLGLGSAYIEGFNYALENGFDFIVQMDADFSHDPKYLLDFIKEAEEGAEIVIGSRYIRGISVVNWSLKRLLLSYFANLYAKIITGVPVQDLTGGFKCISKNALKSVDFTKVKSNGYAFQIELNYALYSNGFRAKEIPIIFTDREEGISKMSKSIILEAIYKVWTFRFKKYKLEQD